ncbi:uncharacterized protein LOC129308868 [Prosopis cineraria]|uniref:uncharacterized protein LOC129308868 n=1 Tax=Prosopis cineraria TaxID=364024 RepID=UPI00240F1B8C|nr:uncharacterized protein LOC129308868 [Prosopis cineraria]
MREKGSERVLFKASDSTSSINPGDGESAARSIEEEDVLARSTKKLDEDVIMQGTETETEAKQREEKSRTQQDVTDSRPKQISYKAKLIGTEDKKRDLDFEEQFQEWLKEETQCAPQWTEEQQKIIDTLPTVKVPDERLKELCKPWKDALILTLMGKKMRLVELRVKLARVWGTYNFELIDFENNYFTFRTDSIELYRKVLSDGPWVISGHCLAVQRWSPNFNPFTNQIQKIALWIRVPVLSMRCYNEEFMWETGNMIGKALKVDMNTLAQVNQKNTVERGRYARVSVEVDLTKPLHSRFIIRRKIFTLIYERISVICFNCGKVRHKNEDCPMKTPETGQPVGEEKNQSTTPKEQKQTPSTSRFR